MKTSDLLFLRPRDSSGLSEDQLAKNPPEIIYHYTSCETAELVLGAGTIKLSAPQTFNDPLDMYEKLIDFTCTDEELEGLIHSLCREYPVVDRLRRIKEIRREGLDKFAADGLNTFRKSKESSRVCCFSTEKDIALMWSHYAKQHTGVCLGFNFAPVVGYGDIEMILKKVNYLKEIRAVKYYDPSNSRNPYLKATNHWLSSKSDVWSYEKEVRALIVNRSGNDLFPFEKACLKEIYFGCRTPTSVRKNLLDLITQKGYNVSIKQQMIIDDTTFNIKPVDF